MVLKISYVSSGLVFSERSGNTLNNPGILLAGGNKDLVISSGLTLRNGFYSFSFATLSPEKSLALRIPRRSHLLYDGRSRLLLQHIVFAHSSQVRP